MRSNLASVQHQHSSVTRAPLIGTASVCSFHHISQRNHHISQRNVSWLSSSGKLAQCLEKKHYVTKSGVREECPHFCSADSPLSDVWPALGTRLRSWLTNVAVGYQVSGGTLLPNKVLTSHRGTDQKAVKKPLRPERN